MSDYLDLLICNPDEEALFDALEQAARLRHLTPHLRNDWAVVEILIAGCPEGRRQRQLLVHGGDAYRAGLAVAWWRDHQSRLHVRVTAGDPGNPNIRRHHSRTDDERPPWWHICPGRVYRVKRGEAKPVWVAACACGEVDTPAQLGWAGGCCGPCHDRREEGVPLPVAEPPLLLEQGGAISGLAFNPNGAELAVSSSWRNVCLYDLTTGGGLLLYEHQDHEDPLEIRPLLYSPSGGELVGVDREASRLRAWRVDGPSCPQTFVNLGPSDRVAGLAYSPNEVYLASCTDNGDLRLWEREEWQDVYLSRGVFSVDFSPDGQVLTIGSNGGVVRVLEVGTWQARPEIRTNAEPNEFVLYVKHTPDGGRLVLITGSHRLRLQTDRWQVRVWDLANRREERSAAIPVVSTVEMTPDGRYLAWLIHDDQHSPAAVHFWDLQAWRSAGWLEWNPEDDLRDLAFSPDGETMATGSSAGVVKLWPWRRLLEGTP